VKVIFAKYAVTDITDEGEEYLIPDNSQIYARQPDLRQAGVAQIDNQLLLTDHRQIIRRRVVSYAC